MSADVKKWINRGGLFAMVVGAVLLVVGGGDVDGAMGIAATAATIAGAVAVLIRELMA